MIAMRCSHCRRNVETYLKDNIRYFVEHVGENRVTCRMSHREAEVHESRGLTEDFAQLVERLNGQGQVLDDHELRVKGLEKGVDVALVRLEMRVKSLEANVESHEQSLGAVEQRFVDLLQHLGPTQPVHAVKILEVPGGVRNVADDPWCTCSKRGECIGCRIERLVLDYLGQGAVSFLDRHRTRWNPGAR